LPVFLSKMEANKMLLLILDSAITFSKVTSLLQFFLLKNITFFSLYYMLLTIQIFHLHLTFYYFKNLYMGYVIFKTDILNITSDDI